MKNEEFLNLTNKIEKNTETMGKLLQAFSPKEEPAEYSDEEKIRAAYALNLCMVSVSQIIDYNDVNILEQEYEAILNNLNLEQMPKDEALLNTLKQLLDTITFFRIQEGDKKFIDREYQQKVKNAIWNAVPNLGIIVAGGSPVTTAFSLASQVGIGYMNYRKNRKDYELEKEKQLWQLQRSAIEQFNGLRRELFDTAWRLADKYGFPDEYRLTERQIHQYNEILMDPDDLRKYDRLEYVKDKFVAYPPFWYFIGSTANAISRNVTLDGAQVNYYKSMAIEYFRQYQISNKYKLLREDKITSSCNLEYAELLLNVPDGNKKEIRLLLNEAVSLSGNANDILELCAIDYIKIGDTSSAQNILKNLVNEEYNTVINAQILSYLYVSDYINYNSKTAQIQYKILQDRVYKEEYLFPMPSGNDYDKNMLQTDFIKNQRNTLLTKYFLVIGNFYRKYNIQFNKILPLPNEKKSYTDSYFIDTTEAREERLNHALAVLGSSKEDRFKVQLKNADFEFRYLELFNEMLNELSDLKCIQNWWELSDIIRRRIKENRGVMNNLQIKLSEGRFTAADYKTLHNLTFGLYTLDFFNTVKKQVEQFVSEKSNLYEFALAESDLREFCIKQAIAEPDVLFNSYDDCISNETVDTIYFSADLIDADSLRTKEISERTRIYQCISGAISSIITNPDAAEILLYNHAKFSIYFENKKLKLDKGIWQKTVAVLDDKTKDNLDLLFTTQGVMPVINNRLKKTIEYKSITNGSKWKNEFDILDKYSNEQLNVAELKKMICELSIDSAAPARLDF